MIDLDDPLITRAKAAELITERIFPVSERVLRKWSEVPLIIIGNRACAERSKWLEAAARRRQEANFGHPGPTLELMEKARTALQERKHRKAG